jgi:hypothetical protein
VSFSSERFSEFHRLGSCLDSLGQGHGQPHDNLLAGDLSVYINDPSGYFTADELASIQAAINAWDTVLAPYHPTRLGDLHRVTTFVRARASNAVRTSHVQTSLRRSWPAGVP